MVPAALGAGLGVLFSLLTASFECDGELDCLPTVLALGLLTMVMLPIIGWVVLRQSHQPNAGVTTVLAVFLAAHWGRVATESGVSITKPATAAAIGAAAFALARLVAGDDRHLLMKGTLVALAVLVPML